MISALCEQWHDNLNGGIRMSFLLVWLHIFIFRFNLVWAVARQFDLGWIWMNLVVWLKILYLYFVELRFSLRTHYRTQKATARRNDEHFPSISLLQVGELVSRRRWSLGWSEFFSREPWSVRTCLRCGHDSFADLHTRVAGPAVVCAWLFFSFVGMCSSLPLWLTWTCSELQLLVKRTACVRSKIWSFSLAEILRVFPLGRNGESRTHYAPTPQTHALTHKPP